MAVDDRTVRWEFREHLEWTPFDEESGASVELSFTQGLLQDSFQLNDVEYMVDLHRLIQVNSETMRERHIRRVPAAPQREDPDHPIWQFREDDEWFSVDRKAQKVLEGAYSQYPMPTATECRFMNRRSGRQEQLYKYNLVRLEQTNAETGFKRDIRRIPAYSPSIGSVPSIPWSALNVGQEHLGSGSFKAVYKGRWAVNDDDKTVAVLVLRAQADGTKPAPAQELAIFARLGRHPHLVQLLATSKSPAGEHAMVLEYAQHGSLFDVLQKQTETGGVALSNEVLITIAMQICLGMQTLHSERILHRDIATRNVLVFAFDHQDRKQASVKICDFGLSLPTAGSTITTNSPNLGGSGPVRWMAPESLSRRQWSANSDVWSCGVLLWEMWTGGGLPYFEVNDNQEVSTGVAEGRLRLRRPVGNGLAECPDMVWMAMQSCWQVQPSARPAPNALRLALEDALIGAHADRRNQNEAEEGEAFCCICQCEPKTVALIPCGHKCLCPGCAGPLATCPLCRAPVQAWHRIYD